VKERGAAVVEFTLVCVVLMTLVLAVVQVGVVIHVRNTLVACAAEGARYGANADRRPVDGASRTAELAAQTLAVGIADEITARQVVVDGVAMVEVEVQATLPLVGYIGIDEAMTVSGHAVDETGW